MNLIKYAWVSKTISDVLYHHLMVNFFYVTFLSQHDIYQAYLRQEEEWREDSGTDITRFPYPKPCCGNSSAWYFLSIASEFNQLNQTMSAAKGRNKICGRPWIFIFIGQNLSKIFLKPFVFFAERIKGEAISTQNISKWISVSIMLSQVLSKSPDNIWPHSRRTWAS